MTKTEAYEAITFIGDSAQEPDALNDIRDCVAEVVSRLPTEVREWLLFETNHLFFCMTGTLGEFCQYGLAPGCERDGQLGVIRFILLGEKLLSIPRDEVLHTIAHEIAHSRRNDDSSDVDAEVATDALAAAWGFPTPASRANDLKSYR